MFTKFFKKSGTEQISGPRFLSRDVLMNLTTRYLGRRIPINSRQSPTALYKGISFRADRGFNNNGMEYYFSNGFVQQDVGALDFDVMNGSAVNGHTGSQGISSTTNFEFAAMWHAKNVYILDLFEHPFSIDINFGARLHNFQNIDQKQFEINIANRLSGDKIIGHYNDETQIFTPNPNYEGSVRII